MSNDHRLIGPGEADYPRGVLDLEEPPPLYVVGSTFHAPAIAVVGTRRCTTYGRNLAYAFGLALARAGWITVSGMARGIDAAAHRGAMASPGPGVAVLGSGIDVIYPRENADIYRALAGGLGAVLSEYPPGIPPDRWRFPARNRLIAAIASAVVVVEAGERGGALITARLGSELGRPVFVVPGDVDRPASVGCNRLLRDGAFPVLGAQDLIAELELILGPIPMPAPNGADTAIPSMGETIDELVERWGCETSEALVRITHLEMDGRVRRVGDRVVPIR
ncbi:MAG: DNA-processing protein DprA [Acidimicrobiia bacterium]